ncbi:hypothetical protein EDB19DRAFT_1261096 [Suillus lakei]|nr:hypothetical protein EDB19DRAFT_1261096 [Suillus lakei]
MLRWQSLALQVILAASILAFADTSTEPKEPSNAPYQCRASAWVRAPDMVPGDIIAGDVRIKLNGSCDDAESYVLGLRYKERIFWKLRRQDAPILKRPEFKHNNMDSNRDLFQVWMPSKQVMTPDYNETEWMAYQNSVQNKELWSLHEEERIAFEIKTPLIGAKGAERLTTTFTTQFGILVPNTNYPPGVDYRHSSWMIHSWGDTDVIYSESIYEYFVEIWFGNGTISEIPAGITSFTPLYVSTKNDALSGNLFIAPADPGRSLEPVALRSNYTIELSFPDGVYQNSSVNIMATVHRMGYTNRTDAPMELCAILSGANIIEWHPQELKNRSYPFMQFIKTLVPSVQHSQLLTVSPPFNPHPCRGISFAAAPADLTGEGHISSSSSEPLSLSIHMSHDAVPDFSTYYQKLGHVLDLNLHVKPDPSEPWEQNSGKTQWEKQTAGMDETDFDWVPCLPLIQTRRRYLFGKASLSVVSMQEQRPVRSNPVHYLSDEARQPTFVDVPDIADLRSMSPEERDLIAPFTQPSITVFAKGEELRSRYFTDYVIEGQPIYVGDTWAHKVLSATAKGQRERDTMDHLLLVQ